VTGLAHGLRADEIWGSERVESVGEQQQALAVRVGELNERVDHLLGGGPVTGDISRHRARTAFHRLADQSLELLAEAHLNTVAAVRRLRHRRSA
jgi:hypothetical protein